LIRGRLFVRLPDSPTWQIEIYEDGGGGRPFLNFADRLDDTAFAALDAAIKLVLRRHGMDLCRTEWMKPLGSGLYEFRVRHDAAEIESRFAGASAVGSARVRILLRVFCHFHGDKVVLLLGGYDKGRDASAKRQQKEISAARVHLADWHRVGQMERAREMKRGRR